MTALTTSERRKLEHYEQDIEEGMGAFMRTGRALLAIREGKLYRGKHETFEDYCRLRWSMGRNYANKIIDATEAADDVSEVEVTAEDGSRLGTIVPKTESVARELTKVDSIPQRADVWAKAVSTAPVNKETGEPKVTAAHVAKTRRELLEEPQPNGKHEENGKAESSDDPLWKQFAAKHAEALNHLTAARKAMNWICAHKEEAAYLSHVEVRIDQDYKNLRRTIAANMPVELKRGKIITKAMARR